MSSILSLGQAIRDLPQNAETSARKAHEETVRRLTREFQNIYAAYLIALPELTLAAKEAECEIKNAALKHTISAIILVADAVLAFGAAIVAIASASLTIGLMAAGFSLLAIPLGMAVRQFAGKIAELEEVIEAPNRQRPHLSLPVYKPEDDLELEETRRRVQKEFACKTSLSKIAHSGYSTNKIISYALLDLMGVQSDKRAAFYAKCAELIRGCKRLSFEREGQIEKAKAAYKKTKEKLEAWKASQNRLMPKTPSRELKKLQEEMHASSTEDNKERLRDALKAIDVHYKHAIAEYECQFMKLKADSVGN